MQQGTQATQLFWCRAMEKPERERERVEATERDRDRERESNELQRECAKRERTQLTKEKVYCIIMGDLQEAEIHKQGKTSLRNPAGKNTTTSKTYMQQKDNPRLLEKLNQALNVQQN